MRARLTLTTLTLTAVALHAPVRAQDDGARAAGLVAPSVAAVEALAGERRLGSAVVVHEAGFLVTNAHVVAGADRITVTLPGRAPLAARLLATAPDDDLALLEVQVEGGRPLPVAPLAADDAARPGQACLAIGNPLGLAGSITRGVVSALDRRLVHDGVPMRGAFLQTDAAIHPGSSGGALIDLRGQVIGITTAVEAAGHGIGFAIPVARLRAALAALSDPLLLRERWLGVELADAPSGARVVKVEQGGPGAAAGLRAGDLITSIGAADVRGAFDVHVPFLGRALEQRLAITGPDGRLRAARLVAGPPPWTAGLRVRLGALVAPAEGGAVVTEVDEGGPAHEIGLRRGDVILRAGAAATRLDGARGLWSLVQPLPEGAPVAVTVRRDGREYRGELKIR